MFIRYDSKSLDGRSWLDVGVRYIDHFDICACTLTTNPKLSSVSFWPVYYRDWSSHRTHRSTVSSCTAELVLQQQSSTSHLSHSSWLFCCFWHFRSFYSSWTSFIPVWHFFYCSLLDQISSISLRYSYSPHLVIISYFSFLVILHVILVLYSKC